MLSRNVIKAVTPAEAGVQDGLFLMDSGFRRNDPRGHFLTSYKPIRIDKYKESSPGFPSCFPNFVLS
jgi:hypothetical protein